MPPYQSGHTLTLLHGGAEFFPALAQALDNAQSEVWMETYIFENDVSGQHIAAALARAAQRGVQVRLVTDGFGTAKIAEPIEQLFRESGVQHMVFSPIKRRISMLFGKQVRRLHRKLVCIDRELAFCGGINVLDDYYDPNHGALKLPRFDFAVRIEGPMVHEVRRTMQRMWGRVQGWAQLSSSAREGEIANAMRAARDLSEGMRRGMQRMFLSTEKPLDTQTMMSHTMHHGVRAALLVRDNVRNRRRIENAYIAAIRAAKREVIIANAYFLPGRALRHVLAQAVQRGVKVSLLLQGRYEYFMQFHATHSLYDFLLAQGITIYEYTASFLHAKVAVIDEQWCTVGSSNLDPLSLLLAQEANVMIDDVAFAAELRTALVGAQDSCASCLSVSDFKQRSLITRALNWIAYGMFRLGVLFTGKNY